MRQAKTSTKPKRAITLGGGGPAAGLHIGVLKKLAQVPITFDVWALSCIGAWVGIIYNQCDKGNEADQTYEFFRNGVFRDDVSYSRFPINTVFGPDWYGNTRALIEFLANLDNYGNIWLPDRIMDSFRETAALLLQGRKWEDGEFNQWVLNNFMAVNPLSRFLTSMMFLSNINGLSKIYYPDSSFLKKIKFSKLDTAEPYIYHNAFNLTTPNIQLFSNKKDRYKQITAASLCACSALPYIEGTVDIDGDTYCEGALVDTVNFKSLLEDHHDFDEIWVSRIVDAKQIHEPRNLGAALGNLCQLFAASLGEDDIRLFEYHAIEDNWRGTIVEIHVDANVNFDWSHSNLASGRDRGIEAADAAHKAYLHTS